MPGQFFPEYNPTAGRGGGGNLAWRRGWRFEECAQLLAMHMASKICHLVRALEINTTHNGPCHMSLCHQHDFVGGKWRSIGDVRQGRNTRHNVLITFETFWGLGKNPNVRVDAQNLIFQTGLKTTHHRKNHNQNHDVNGNPAHGDHRNQGDKRLPASRLQIAQAHCECVGHSGDLWYSAALYGGTVRHEVSLN